MPAIARFFAFLCLVALLPVRVAAAGDIPEEKRFVFLSSTIGPIEAGIVPALEEAFEKDGFGTRRVPMKFGAPLFFPNSTEYRKAAGLPAGDF